MNLCWLEQTEADVPPENDWLSASELARLGGMHFAKRRADWRLGRWTAKRALSVCLDLPGDPQVFQNIEIRPAASGAPQVFVVNQPAAFTISLSHRDGVAACAVADAGMEMGCDLELVEARSDAFVADYFTVEEQALIVRTSPIDRARILALLWSAKESALKALHEGLRLDTRSVVVAPVAGRSDLYGWSPLQVRYTGGQIFDGWWQHKNNMVRTVVGTPAPDAPTWLTVPAHYFDCVSRCA